MFMKVRDKLSGRLAGLALWPVVGWGQEILVDPENATVCAGESAIFTTQAVLGSTSDIFVWLIDGARDFRLPPEKLNLITFLKDSTGLDRQEAAIFRYNETFNGITVQSVLATIDGSDMYSYLAYLFYQPNQQFSATGLIHSVNNTVAQFEWDTHDSNFTTQYLLGIYDSNNNLITYQVTNTTHASFDLLPVTNGTCQQLELRVTADQCPDPDSGFIQTEATSFSFTVNCPATEAEIPGQPSGTQANYPSLLLAVAAIIPLLKWQH